MPVKQLNLVGQRFGKLSVVRRAPSLVRRTAWLCRCDCGNEATVTTLGLRRKVRPVLSCGCLVAIRSHEVNSTHGMKGSREYSAWRAMLSRCLNPNTADYARYGAVGIAVCDRWKSFENFYADMGPRPIGHTIERNDGTGDYCPDNCRWATYEEQAINRSTTVFVTVPVKLLERALGMSNGNLLRRLDNGWDIETAITTATQKQFARPQRKSEPA